MTKYADKETEINQDLLTACKEAVKYFTEFDGIDVVKIARLMLVLEVAISKAEFQLKKVAHE